MRRRALLGGAAALFVDLGDARADGALELDVDSSPLALPAGRSRIQVTAPAASFVSIAIRGPREALLGARAFGDGLLGRSLRVRAMDEDSLLPRLFSGETAPGEPEVLSMLVDVVDPVTLAIAAVSTSDDKEPTAKGLKEGTESPRPLIGFPAPASWRAGYVVGGPARYAFGRIDVVKSLVKAFAKTRKTFSSDPLWISDMSQWNGKRPKSDLGEVRHISHEGGCDVDLGLPASDTLDGNVRDHCKRVFLDPTHAGCAPGTAKGVDFERLAYVLGVLADETEGRITKVFLDDVYRREVIRVAKDLRERDLLKEDAQAALSEEGVLVASPWHTDHVHVRFAGERARALFE